MAELAGGFIPAGEQGNYVRGQFNPGTGRLDPFKTMGKDSALVIKRGEKEPPGWAVIVLGFGDDPNVDSGPLDVTAGTWTIVIPRNITVAIPPAHFENLLQSTETRYIQPALGQQLIGYKAHRYNIQVVKWPESANQAVNEYIEETKAVHEKIEVD